MNTWQTPLWGKQLSELPDESSKRVFVACPANFKELLGAVHLVLIKIPFPDGDPQRDKFFLPHGACILFLWLLAQVTTNLVTYKNTNILLFNSGDQKYGMGLTG